MNDNRAQSSKLSAAGVSSPAEAAGASARGLRQSSPGRSRQLCLPISNRNIPLLDTSVSACKHVTSLFLIATLSLLLWFAAPNLLCALPPLPASPCKIAPRDVEAIPTPVLDCGFLALRARRRRARTCASVIAYPPGGGVVMLLQWPATNTRLVLSRHEFPACQPTKSIATASCSRVTGYWSQITGPTRLNEVNHEIL
jgi:hypothetical protein